MSTIPPAPAGPPVTVPVSQPALEQELAGEGVREQALRDQQAAAAEHRAAEHREAEHREELRDGAAGTSVDPVSPAGAMAPTGPIEGLPDLPPPPETAAAAPARRRIRASRGLLRGVRLRTGVAGPALGIVSVVLLELGLVVHEGGRSVWTSAPLWAAFATLAALVGLVAFVSPLPGLRRLGAGRTWAVAAGGLCGLAAFWLLVALPVADTDRGFLLTAAVACLGAALWTAPGRAVPGARAVGESR